MVMSSAHKRLLFFVYGDGQWISDHISHSDTSVNYMEGYLSSFQELFLFFF